MARPKKQEVDYFPHYCEHGKVLFVIEDRWGNDGYAAFYRLMELLGKTNGHCYDCHEPENWEYLIAVIRVDENIAISILNKLASMGVIDKGLWGERRIWMQSFVDSITDVYARRKVDLPTKPLPITGFPITEIPLSGVNDNRNPQSKVKESKVLKDHCPKVFSDDSLEMRMSKYMANRIKESYPGVKLPSNYNKWCLSFGRLIQIDGRTPEEIGKVIKWVYADDFWCTNIRSPDKLREKWDTLWLQMNRKQNKQQNKPIEQWTREEREAAGI